MRGLGDHRSSESSGELRSSALCPSQAELWGKWGTHEGVTAEVKPQAYLAHTVLLHIVTTDADQALNSVLIFAWGMPSVPF